MGSFGSKSFALADGDAEFVDRTGGLLLATNQETIRLNNLIQMTNGGHSYLAVSSVPKKTRKDPLEDNKKAYVLTLGNPDISSPNILYEGDRGVLQITVYSNAYLDQEIAYYGVVLPPVVFSGTTAFDGLRSSVRFGTMVEATDDDETPFRIAPLENVRKSTSHVYLNHIFSVICSSVTDPTDSSAVPSIDTGYQQITFTTVMEGKDVWRPPLTLTLYRFKAQFKEDKKELVPVTKLDGLTRLGSNWSFQPSLKLVDENEDDTITLTGTATFTRRGQFYFLPFYHVVPYTS